MKKNIFVNNTAATSGGALTILREFVKNIPTKFNENCIFYIFCTAELNNYECENVKIINNINAKLWKDRIKWDFHGLKRWSKENNINPDLIISLQNTGVVGFKNIPQIIYLHQPLPYYSNEKWNLLKREERIYWIYKYIYKYLIAISIKNNKVIVQTNWMKKAVSKVHKKSKDEIYVIPPRIDDINDSIISPIQKKEDIMLFYPASSCIYKNHYLIIDAISLLIKENINKTIRLYLTIDKESNNSIKIYEYAKNKNLLNNIEFIGSISYETVLRYYKACDIMLFPSYIETYGLPLIEASKFGIPIIASDLDYAKEVIGKYEGVKFVNHKDAREWCESIKKQYIVNKKYISEYIEDKNTWNEFIQIIKNEIEYIDE